MTNRGCPETIVTAIKEANLRGSTISLGSSNQLSILLVGCRDWIEGGFSYENVAEDLKKCGLYPDLSRVDFTLCGPEVSSAKKRSFERGNYTITKVEGLLETAFTLERLSTFSVVFVLQPGLSDYIRSWTPAFRLLVESNLPVITTGYSHVEHWSMDAMFDEEVLSTYFGANIIVPITRNYAACPLIEINGMIPYAFYIIFQGPRVNSEVPLLTYEQIIHNNRVTFLTWLGRESIDHEENSVLGNACLRMVEDLKVGKIKIPIHVTHKQIETQLQNAMYSF
jgi:hypothetical protein